MPRANFPSTSQPVFIFCTAHKKSYRAQIETKDRPAGLAHQGATWRRRTWRQNVASAPSIYVASQDVASKRGVTKPGLPARVFKMCLQSSGDMCTPTGDHPVYIVTYFPKGLLNNLGALAPAGRQLRALCSASHRVETAPKSPLLLMIDMTSCTKTPGVLVVYSTCVYVYRHVWIYI